MIKIKALHHVSVPVTNIERAREFYEGTLGLKRSETPPRPKEFDFDGEWYDLGERQLHLIFDERGTSTFRKGKKVDSRDAHFALRVDDYEATLEFLTKEKGYINEESDRLQGDDRLKAVKV